jgi:anti-sigma regulatory factor (Ser/Thr protein kinase)
MVSEAVSNAGRHGKPEDDGRIGLRLEADNGVLRAAAMDGAPEFHFTADGRSHYGLFIVDDLADRLGLSLDGKKAVWFEVDWRPRTV